MKSVIISIKPEWCELIASDEKAIEIRKTKPNLDIPFKVYIYCTKPKAGTDQLWILGKRIRPEYNGLSAVCANLENPTDSMLGNGKVIGEFVCNNIYEIDPAYAIDIAISAEACVRPREIHEYLKGKTGYGWSISGLKIYDQPKELSTFSAFRKCNSCKKSGYECTACMWDENRIVPVAIERPPQSWCYTEEKEEANASL